MLSTELIRTAVGGNDPPRAPCAKPGPQPDGAGIRQPAQQRHQVHAGRRHHRRNRRSDREEVWIEVRDTGPGILSEEQERVFEPFYRSQHERRFPQGLGLGLTIGRDLVEAHGGRLDLESKPREGSRFTIHLPRKVPPED